MRHGPPAQAPMSTRFTSATKPEDQMSRSSIPVALRLEVRVGSRNRASLRDGTCPQLAASASGRPPLWTRMSAKQSDPEGPSSTKRARARSKAWCVSRTTSDAKEPRRSVCRAGATIVAVHGVSFHFAVGMSAGAQAAC